MKTAIERKIGPKQTAKRHFPANLAHSGYLLRCDVEGDWSAAMQQLQEGVGEEAEEELGISESLERIAKCWLQSSHICVE